MASQALNLEIPAPELAWAHKPSPFAWSVLCYGDGGSQVEVLFHKRTRPTGYGLGLEGILYRANDYAKMQHRARFAVRDVDGRVIYDGPVLDEVEAPKLFAAIAGPDVVAISRGQRRYERENRHG